MSAAVASSANFIMPGLQPLSSHNNNTSDHNVNRLTLNLSSNNPFRGRSDSPALTSPRSATSSNSIAPPSQPDARNRMSKNPFLDDAEIGTAVSRPNNINVPADIFNDLSLLDKPANERNPAQKGAAPPPPPYAGPQARGPPANGSNAPLRGPPRQPGSPRKPDADRHRRPRGMSETSAAEKERRDRRERDRENSDRPPRTESEERRRQERRKAREERHRREKEAGKDGKKPRRLQGLDIIDKLDVTGIYGQGLFHHDGPFDACNPHRNAKRDRKAPMQAFPANSANMALGGSGPINTRLDLDRFHGRGEEAFDAFNTTARRGKTDTVIIDPTSRVEAIHGAETYGLGTSTFLEGAPASRKDLQRQDTDDREMAMNGGGLSRKKSLAQKFRGMSSGRATRPDMRSPDATYNGEVFDPSPAPQGNKSVSAGGMARAHYNRDNEYNPFDNDYGNADYKKTAHVRTVEQTAGRAHTPTSPNGGRGLVRTVTTESDIVRPGSGDGEGSKSGFLSRMKSLKGGKRSRPERRAS